MAKRNGTLPSIVVFQSPAVDVSAYPRLLSIFIYCNDQNCQTDAYPTSFYSFSISFSAENTSGEMCVKNGFRNYVRQEERNVTVNTFKLASSVFWLPTAHNHITIRAVSPRKML